MFTYLARWKAHFLLLFSNYLLTASRMVAVFAMRMFADPVTVGVINAVQTVSNITGTLSLGSVYTAVRAIPLMSETDKARHANAALIATIIEGVLVALISALAVGMVVYGSAPWPISIVFLAGLFSFVTRIQVYLESVLQVLGRFTQIVITRFIRVFEPVLALLGLYWFGISGYFFFGFIFLMCVFIWNWRKIEQGFQCLSIGVKQAITSIKNPNSYGAWVAAERFVMGLASLSDALLVTLTLGPVALSGYYLGINIRGLLQQVASTFIFQRWSHAVQTYEHSKRDIFSSSSFLLKYLVLSTVLLAGTFIVLWSVFEWILPSYKQHFLECMWVSAVAIPYSFTGFLRVSQLLAMKGKQLLIISLGRLGLLASAYGILMLNHIEVTAPIIGMMAYATAVAEFTINYFIVTKYSAKSFLLWLSVCLSPVVIIHLFNAFV
jgi:hypothetical protein